MELRVSLLRIRILVGVGGAEEDAFAQVHQAHEHAGDYDDDQCGREDQRCAERVVCRLQPDAEAFACAQIFRGRGGGEM